MKPRILAIIPARGGSKGIPRKNIRDLGGKPLIAWTIEEAKKSKYIDRVILSSEDDEIIGVAKEYGCEVPFKRPIELAQDDTSGVEPVLHAIEQCPGYDYVVLLQPTSPFRTVEDIDGCIEKLLNSNADYCVSVTEPDKSPYWMFTLENDILNPLIKGVKEVSRRQDLKKAFALNGAVYAGNIKSIIKDKSFYTDKTLAYKMSKEKSLDIDTEWDFKICELLKKGNN